MRWNCIGRYFAVLLLTVLFAAVGCGGGKGTITGKVTYDGKTVPAGKVTFLSETGNKQPFFGAIKDGVYTVDDCPSGPVKISVETFPPRPAVSANVPPPGMPKDMAAKFSPPANAESYASPPGQYVQLPAKYADPTQSGLAYTVISGKQDHPLELNK